MTTVTHQDPGSDAYPGAFILLTGGAGHRLGGVDKATLRVGGQTLLGRAVAQAAGRPVVVVGPDPTVVLPVIVTIEDPPGGGPAAGVSAGVTALLDRRPDTADEELTAVLAIDHVGVRPATWRRLAAAAGQAAAGAILTDGGRRQYGVGVFPFRLLRQACAAQPTWHGRPLRSLLDPIVTVEVPARDDESHDIDTLEDLSWWRARADTPPATDEPVDEGTPR